MTSTEIRPPDRAWYLGSAFVLVVAWPIGLALFIIWAVVASLSLFTVIAPLLIPVSAAIRGYAQAYRRWAARALGRTVQRPQSPVTRQPRRLFGTVVAVLKDPAIWREWAWLLVNATAGFALALIPVALLGSAVLYACYPLLYALTPQEAFGTVFGIFELQSVAEAWLVTPIALVCFWLWLVTVRSLPMLYARIVAGMLGSYGDRGRA